MSLSLWLTFLLAAILISVSPGAGAINTISSGLRYGVKRSLPAIMGLQLGFGIQIVLVGIGGAAGLIDTGVHFAEMGRCGVSDLAGLAEVARGRIGLS